MLFLYLSNEVKLLGIKISVFSILFIAQVI